MLTIGRRGLPLRPPGIERLSIVRRIRSRLAIALLGALAIQSVASLLAPKAARAGARETYVAPTEYSPFPGPTQAHRPMRYVPVGKLPAHAGKDPRTC